MKDIINLNAKETNIAIVWAVLLIFTVITQLFLLSVINFNVVLCVYGLLPAMHLFWRKDIFAPLKQKYPFGVTLFAFVGRLFRLWILFHILAIIFMLALKQVDEQFFQIANYITCFVGVLGLIYLIYMKIKFSKLKQSFPIVIGYQNIAFPFKINHLVIGIAEALFLIMSLLMNYLNILD